MKKSPYGQTDFEKIRTENYAYVDKTRFIEKLEDHEIRLTVWKFFHIDLFFLFFTKFYFFNGAFS